MKVDLYLIIVSFNYKCHNAFVLVITNCAEKRLADHSELNIFTPPKSTMLFY